MKPRTVQPHSELTSLVISPNRELAQQFTATLPLTRSFHILAEMKSYPPVQTLDIRLRQLRPDLVFLDLATDLDLAAELIEFIAAIRPPVFVVGLHFLNDSAAILRSLRAGATEFLYAPFDLEMQRRLWPASSVCGSHPPARKPTADGCWFSPARSRVQAPPHLPARPLLL